MAVGGSHLKVEEVYPNEYGTFEDEKMNINKKN